MFSLSLWVPWFPWGKCWNGVPFMEKSVPIWILWQIWASETGLYYSKSNKGQRFGVRCSLGFPAVPLTEFTTLGKLLDYIQASAFSSGEKGLPLFVRYGQETYSATVVNTDYLNSQFWKSCLWWRETVDVGSVPNSHVDGCTLDCLVPICLLRTDSWDKGGWPVLSWASL